MGRKLVTLQKIAEINPIPGADAIDVAKVKGWNVVVKKDEFQVGDFCIYFEIDSFLPIEVPAFSFLESRGVRTLNEVRGHVLKTAKLRGQISQGLLLKPEDVDIDLDGLILDQDLSDLLGIEKYEPPIPASISGIVAGSFPTKYISKTDAERIQNLTEVWDEIQKYEWIATEKIDGTSMTVIVDEEHNLRVCGRNWEYTDTKGENDNTLWKIARQLNERHSLIDNDLMFFQAELFGEGIQGNL
jgi:RNA ligase (TIGR02306 family)